jgi:hypothetical protein
MLMQTPHSLRNSYIPDDPARRILRKLKFGINMLKYIYVYTRECSKHPKSTTPEPDRPQHDRQAACVTDQQNSSATFVSLLIERRSLTLKIFLLILY